MRATPSPATIYSDLEHENATSDRCSAMTTTTHEAQAAHTNVFAATADAAGIVAGSTAGSSSTATPTPKRMVLAYERFLGMPVLVVLAAMWAAGVAILGSCVLVLYVVGSVLLQAVAGSS